MLILPRPEDKLFTTSFFRNLLGDKLSCDLFQRHRDTQSWKWEQEGGPADYEFAQLRIGTGNRIGLLLSLSGKVGQASLPNGIRASAPLYEIELKGQQPNREFLRLREDLAHFRRTYQAALSTIMRNHEGIEELHLFPAIPAPVGVACGQELLPKVHPNVVIYDNVKGVFEYAITINSREDL